MVSVGMKADAPNRAKTKHATRGRGGRRDPAAAYGTRNSDGSLSARLVGYRLAGEVVLEYEVVLGRGAGLPRRLIAAVRFPSETRSLLEHLPWADRPTIMEVLDRVARRSLANRWAGDDRETEAPGGTPDPRRASVDVLSMTLRSELRSCLARSRAGRVPASTSVTGRG
jgi:hypothetical protein